MQRTTTRKKYALIAGYVGSNFFGSCFQPTLPKTSTVEGLLHDTLHKANLISHQNYDEIAKAKMVSSSRTDKHVHSLCSVVSVKLDIDRQLKEELVERDPLGFGLADEINKYLPDDVRIFSVQRPVSSFCARNFTVFRAYDYLVPVSILKHGEQSIARFQECANQFAGSQYIINFMSLSAIPTEKFSRLSLEELSKSCETFAEREQAYLNLYRSNLLSDHQRYLTKVTVDEVVEIGGEKYLVVHLLANSFVYNQIRNMISAIIAQTNELVPDDYISLLLGYPRYSLRPLLSPPNTLMIRTCGQHVPINDRLNRGLTMSHEELHRRTDSFKRNVVYPHIQSIVSSSDIFQTFSSDLQAHYEKLWDSDRYRTIQNINHEWRQWVQERVDNYLDKEERFLSSRLDQQLNSDDTKPSSLKNSSYLPRNLMNDLCLHFNQIPHQEPVQHVMEYLLEQVMSRTIPVSLRSETFIRHIQEKGGFEKIVMDRLANSG